MVNLSACLRQAYEMGLVSSAQMVRFLEISVRPTAIRKISHLFLNICLELSLEGKSNSWGQKSRLYPLFPSIGILFFHFDRCNFFVLNKILFSRLDMSCPQYKPMDVFLSLNWPLCCV